jgi:hypothetical protein
LKTSDGWYSMLRMRMIAAVGGILAALTFMGTIANGARLNCVAYRTEAEIERRPRLLHSGPFGYSLKRRSKQVRRQMRVGSEDCWNDQCAGEAFCQSSPSALADCDGRGLDVLGLELNRCCLRADAPARSANSRARAENGRLAA